MGALISQSTNPMESICKLVLSWKVKISRKHQLCKYLISLQILTIKCFPTTVFIITYCFMCMSVLSTCMSMHYVPIWCPQKLEEGVRCSETKVPGAVSHHVVLGTKLRPSGRAGSQ